MFDLEQRSNTGTGYCFWQPAFSYFSYSVMVGYAASICQDLIPCYTFDLFKNMDRVRHATVVEGEVKVHTCSHIVGLSDAAGDKMMFYASLCYGMN